MSVNAKASRASGAACGLNSRASFARYDRPSSSWRTSQHSARGASTSYSGTWPRAGTMRNGSAYRRRPLEHRTSATGYGLLPGIALCMFNRADPRNRAGVLRWVAQNLRVCWPTPTAFVKCLVRSKMLDDPIVWDQRVRRNAKRGGPDQLHLNIAVKLCPTDTDWKAARRRTKGSVFRKRREADSALFVTRAGGRTGSLNPAWVDWLMGYPTGWAACKPSATR